MSSGAWPIRSAEASRHTHTHTHTHTHGLAHPLGGGQQGLAVRGEGVVLPAADPAEHEPVVGQGGLLGVEGLQRGVLNGQQLGGLEGEGLAQLHQEVLGLGAHLLVHGVAGVLVALAEGVGDDPVALELNLVLEPEEGQQGGGALGQTAPVLRQAAHQAPDAVIGLPPGLVAGVQVGDGPGIRRVHLTAGGKGMCHSYDSFAIKIIYYYPCRAKRAGRDSIPHNAPFCHAIRLFEGENVGPPGKGLI